MNWPVRNSLSLGNMTDAIMRTLEALVFTCVASISLSKYADALVLWSQKTPISNNLLILGTSFVLMLGSQLKSRLYLPPMGVGFDSWT